jgi:predicted acetyltransferase
MSADGAAGDGRYQVRSFRPGRGGAVDRETAGWLEAVALTFHQPVPTAEHSARVSASFATEDRVLTGAYLAGPPVHAWDAERPVATYATFVKSMNVGGGNPLDVQLIADVTVRATHRRRGLLRAIISADLRQAAASGVAVAALRASEATIYERFGFGPAVLARHVELDTGAGFALHRRPAGHVEVTDPATMLTVSPQVFDRFHRQTTGSITRQAFYPSKIAGIWAEDRPLRDPSTRAALHYDPSDRIDGYVTYRFVERSGGPGAIEVTDLVFDSHDAYLGLWEYLASIDLVAVVGYRQAPVTDPLPWAIKDRRGFRVVGEEDAVWLRVLDPVAALRARGYGADGEVRIAVLDPLRICGGVYHLVVRGGRASVTVAPSDDAPSDVSMDVSSFGSLYLGGVSARVLAAAGRITARSDAARDELDALMSQDAVPHCITQF